MLSLFALALAYRTHVRRAVHKEVYCGITGCYKTMKLRMYTTQYLVEKCTYTILHTQVGIKALGFYVLR
jgi:hypothetical protein